jgi:uncharacterized secreted protein with C-terminal beta-propeller domain
MPRSPLFIALALAASCGSQPQPARIAKDPSLHAVQGCAAVEKSVQDAAVAQMRHQLEAQIMWRRLWGGGVGVANGGPATGAGPASSGPSSSSPSAWTTTNTQVAGVDEPDFVKNDATHIFVLSGRKLFSAASWPPQQLGLGPSLSIEGYPIEMFLDEKSRIAAPARNTILSDYAGVVYASTSSLYLASAHWWWWDEPCQIDWTYLHRFDISSGVNYMASGGFAGHPLNQFSLDEDAGYLRVAVNTMTRSRVSVGTGSLKHDEWHFDMSNAVRVLGSTDMTVVGELNDLSPGEWVQSSRFIGSRGFVVTFKRIDPLFALDLSDPRDPRKAGVLEVPGFSSYLQPIDDSHLLAIGVDLPDPSANWQNRSLQLSVFDVSDLSAPKRAAQARIGSAWAYSDALWDHHAFNWFKEKSLLAVPFYDWDPSVNPGSGTYWNSFVSDLRVFEVTPTSINLRGALTMKDLFVTTGSGNWTWSWSPWIRRSVMASDDSGAAYVYAVSDAGIRVAPVSTLSQPLATVTFPQQR